MRKLNLYERQCEYVNDSRKYRSLSSATEWYPNGLIRGPIPRAVVFDHYLHGLLFKGITFLESHLFSTEHLSLFSPNPLSCIDSMGIYERQHNSRQRDWLLLPWMDAARNHARGFPFSAPTAFLLFPLLLRKDFSVVRNVNCGNSRAFIRQTIRYASINPHYEFAQVISVIKSISCTLIKIMFFVREIEWTHLISVVTNIFSLTLISFYFIFTTSLQFLFLFFIFSKLFCKI